MSSAIGSSCCLPTRHLNSRRFQVDTTCRKLAAPVPTAPSCLPLPVVLHDSESFWFIWEISLKLWWIWYEIFRYLAYIGFIKSKGCSVYAKVGFCQHKCKDSDVQFSWLPPRKWWHNWIYTFGHLIPACACHPMPCSNISSYIVLTCKSSIPLSHHTQAPKTKKNPEKKNAAMSCSRFLSAWHIPLSMIYLETCQALLKNTTWSLGSQTTTLEYIIISTCLSESQNFQLLQNSVLFQNLRERYELVHHLPVYLLMRISYLKKLPHFPWDHSATSRRSSSLLFSSRSACEWKWKVDHDAIILPLYNSKRI